MPYIRTIASALVSLIAFSPFALGGDSIADLPKKAIERSQITLPGSHPFVLKATVLEITNPANTNYRAEIEEYWVAPDKWRRVVKTPGFSETLTMNGKQTSEQLSGDYYPNWLRTIVAAIFDPGDVLKGVDMSRSSDNPMIGGTKVCRRFTSMAGVAPVSNKVFSTFCFDEGLIDSVAQPGYEAIYSNYKNFAGKHVARTISEQIESGTRLEATIEELTELKSPDDAMFAVQDTSAPLQTIRADEPTLRSLAVNPPDIVWPAVHGGANKGTLSLYVCLDRSGHVREVYELNSSNPGLSDVARDQVMKWQFKTASSHGVPVQVESILTFAFHTTTASDK
ncbi:MAG: energy transducer TonB [Candidatus Sulfotelmatobacter sp.]